MVFYLSERYFSILFFSWLCERRAKNKAASFAKKKKTKQNINYDSESAHSLLFLMEFKFGSVGFLVQKGKAAHEPKAQTAGCHPSSLA